MTTIYVVQEPYFAGSDNQDVHIATDDIEAAQSVMLQECPLGEIIEWRDGRKVAEWYLGKATEGSDRGTPWVRYPDCYRR